MACEKRVIKVRTGIAAGASIPAQLMERIHKKLNLKGLTICYGMLFQRREVDSRHDGNFSRVVSNYFTVTVTEAN